MFIKTKVFIGMYKLQKEINGAIKYIYINIITHTYQNLKSVWSRKNILKI